MGRSARALGGAGRLSTGNVSTVLPIICVRVSGKTYRALVDSGSNCSVATVRIAQACNLPTYKADCVIGMLNGESAYCKQRAGVQMYVRGMKIDLSCILVDRVTAGCDIILGLDVIHLLQGVTIKGEVVTFGCKEPTVASANSCSYAGGVDRNVSVGVQENLFTEVNGSDFSAVFDGKKWGVRWMWRSGEP